MENINEEEINEILERICHDLPDGFYDYLIKAWDNAGMESLFKGKIQMQLVVDTNILFMEVRSLMLNGTSFFQRIASNPLIKFFAPSTLQLELIAKIKRKFPKEKKTRELDIDTCLKKAEELLTLVEINDQICTKAYQKAESQLGQRDLKDVPFLAMSLSMNAHGLVTKDKDFAEQEEVKIWSLKEAGRMLSGIKTGTLSFFIVSETVPPIFDMVYGTIIALWKGIIDLVASIVALIARAIKGGIDGLMKLPGWLLLILLGGALFVVISDGTRKKAGDFLYRVWEFIKDFLSAIRDVIKGLTIIFKEIWEALKPIVITIGKLLLYFTMSSGKLLHKIDELEKVRPSKA